MGSRSENSRSATANRLAERLHRRHFCAGLPQAREHFTVGFRATTDACGKAATQLPPQHRPLVGAADGLAPATNGGRPVDELLPETEALREEEQPHLVAHLEE